jgi:hypothetical protein
MFAGMVFDMCWYGFGMVLVCLIWFGYVLVWFWYGLIRFGMVKDGVGMVL